MTSREIAFDCRFFRGDRPCVFHKQSGVVCTCDFYEKIDERVLVTDRGAGRKVRPFCFWTSNPADRICGVERSERVGMGPSLMDTSSPAANAFELLELPDTRPTEREIREDEDGARRLAGFMLRRNADRVQATARVTAAPPASSRNRS